MDARQFDSGFTVRITVQENGIAVDVSAATVGFTFRPPRGSDFAVVAVFNTDGTDGVLEYVIQPGELAEAGRWLVFPIVVFPGGLNLRGVGVSLVVDPAPEA